MFRVLLKTVMDSMMAFTWQTHIIYPLVREVIREDRSILGVHLQAALDTVKVLVGKSTIELIYVVGT